MERGNALFYECIEDAIKDDIAALKGPKEAAGLFFPEKTVDQGAALIRAWYNPERAERPSPGQYIMLKRLAKERGSFACVRYEEQVLSCRVSWVDPEDELTTLLREWKADRERSTRRDQHIERALTRLEQSGGARR